MYFNCWKLHIQQSDNIKPLNKGHQTVRGMSNCTILQATLNCTV